MQLLKDISKRRFNLSLVLFMLLLLCVMLMLLPQPYILHRLASKMYVYYEINLLKYPNSRFVQSEIEATSKVSMATDYTYCTSDDIDTVREYMEQQIPGFVHLRGVRVVNEPTYSNGICANETVFQHFFQILDRGYPCVEVTIYPSDIGNTSIIITEHWNSAGFARWLRLL